MSAEAMRIGGGRAVCFGALLVGTVAAGTVLGAQSTRPPFAVPTWAFPTAPAAAAPAPKPDSVVLRRVPRSTRTYTMRQVSNGFDIPDWFPQSHPPMPASVQYGVPPNARGCGYCHLPDGQGRPENGTLAGLPAEYTIRQVAAFRNGTRLAANPASATNSMHTLAKAVADSDVVTAARYFEHLALTRRNRVVEVARVPKTRIEGMLFAYGDPGTEPLDGRLIEVPETFERHELRDPGVPYISYVPVGSIARGRSLATRGPAGAATSCVACHGPDLLGKDQVPPIAGRAPSNILRQLINFRTGARSDSASASMWPVVERLTVRDMVALAAYVGSRKPTR
jgi:cytochrome c553